MRTFRYGRGRKPESSEIDMSPMMDMIFILLIFFIVTTSFVKESGVEVNRPVANTTTEKEQTNIVISITKDGEVIIEKNIIDPRSVRAKMERFLSEEPEGSVVISADRDSNTGIVITVLDACRLAGVKNISVAARKPSK